MKVSSTSEIFIAPLGSRNRDDQGPHLMPSKLAKTFRPPVIGESEPSGLIGKYFRETQ